MDLIIDTQILSYRFKNKDMGIDISNTNLAITSITAHEFLITQPKELDKPDYYLLHPSRYKFVDENPSTINYFKNPNHAKYGSSRTDQIIIDFGNQFPAYQQFGNEAISIMINDRKVDLYKLSICHLPKRKQKYLLKRFIYIINNVYCCYSLTESSLDKAFNLFSEFVSKHNCKNNIRNTINDLLILSTAIDRNKKFITYDNELNIFAAEYYEAPVHKYEDKLLIDFSENQPKKIKNKESKSYINKGWSYVIRNKQVSPQT